MCIRDSSFLDILLSTIHQIFVNFQSFPSHSYSFCQLSLRLQLFSTRSFFVLYSQSDYISDYSSGSRLCALINICNCVSVLSSSPAVFCIVRTIVWQHVPQSSNSPSSLIASSTGENPQTLLSELSPSSSLGQSSSSTLTKWSSLKSGKIQRQSLSTSSSSPSTGLRLNPSAFPCLVPGLCKTS